MTDLSHHSTVFAPTLRRGRRTSWLVLPYICVFTAGATGLLVGRAMGGDAGAFEDKLLLLLRFMAVMKFAGVLAAGGLLHWRLTQPIGSRLSVAYLAALAAMAMAPGLIWSLGGIALGALLFHAGLLAFLILAGTDDGARLPRRR